MFEKGKKRKEFERLAECNEFSMVTIVEMRMNIRTIGGGDAVGDIESRHAREQFVRAAGQNDFGYSVGVHASALAEKLLTPADLVRFKDAIVSCVDEYIDALHFDMDEIVEKNKGDQK